MCTCMYQIFGIHCTCICTYVYECIMSNMYRLMYTSCVYCRCQLHVCVLNLLPPSQLSTLHELETDLRLELREHRVPSPSHLQLYLAVSKLLTTAWSLPSDFLPHFQLYVHCTATGMSQEMPRKEIFPSLQSHEGEPLLLKQ